MKALKREQDTQISKKLSTSLQSQNKRDFWKEEKRTVGNFQSVVNVIDDEYGNENINNAFADKCCELYNSVTFHKNIMAKILSKLSGKISNECLSKKYYSSHVIEVSDVID